MLVCLSVTLVSPAKTAALIDMPFGPRTWVGPGNHVLDGDPDPLMGKGDILRPVFSTSRVQNVSDMHSKFALRPHHVWKYGRHPICDR